MVGGELYRYAFQGQEKDPETGKEAFQLRLWDGRIGRWLTTDPYGQYNSPYVGMGNDPINGIDPDGGFRNWFQAVGAWIGGGFRGSISRNDNAATPYHKFGINKTKSSGYLHMDYGLNVAKMNKWGYRWGGDGSAHNVGYMHKSGMLSNLDAWRNKPPENTIDLLQHMATELTYGSVENVKVMLTGSTFTGNRPQGYHRADKSLDGFIDVATFGYSTYAKSAKVVKSFSGYNDFSKSTKGMFKGSNHATIRAEAYDEMIKLHNSYLKKEFGNINSFLDKTEKGLEYTKQSIEYKKNN